MQIHALLTWTAKPTGGVLEESVLLPAQTKGRTVVRDGNAMQAVVFMAALTTTTVLHLR